MRLGLCLRQGRFHDEKSSYACACVYATVAAVLTAIKELLCIRLCLCLSRGRFHGEKRAAMHALVFVWVEAVFTAKKELLCMRLCLYVCVETVFQAKKEQLCLRLGLFKFSLNSLKLKNISIQLWEGNELSRIKKTWVSNLRSFVKSIYMQFLTIYQIKVLKTQVLAIDSL